MTISDEIDGLRADRDSIRAAIVGKGGALPEGSPMSDYPAAIEAIPAGGGEPVSVPYLTAAGSSSSPRAFLSIAQAATSLDGFELNTTGITTCTTMFRGCSRLTSVPMLDTSTATTFSTMFYGCSSLTTVPQLDTSQGTNFRYMFYGCSSLTQIGIHGFTRSISISGCQLDADNLNAFFTQAGEAYDESQIINITGNPGADTCDKTIATDKGWTVTG